MFSFLSKCWGGMGISSPFQKARINATYPDWKAPSKEDIEYIIQSFRGQNLEIRAQTAIHMFFSHLERDNDLKNAPFMLKHLLVMDRCIDEGVQVDTIGQYYNSEFLYGKYSQSSGILFKDLIAQYSIYVKEKAKAFISKPKDLFENTHVRKEYILHKNQTQIFAEIDFAIQLQKAINNINDKFKNGNKNFALVQQIFIGFLRTYIFCYSTVSISIMTLFDRFDRLNKVQLSNLKKLVLYFNKDYTRNFFNFIEMNKGMQAFKDIVYTQILKIDLKYLEIIDRKIIAEVQKASETNIRTTKLPMEDLKQIEVQPIDEDIIECDVPIHRQPKIQIELEQPSNQDMLFNFADYVNFYNEQFEEDEYNSLNSSRINENNNKKLDGSSLSTSSKKITHIVSLTDSIEKTKSQQLDYSIKSHSLIEPFNKFNQKLWNEWNNIYAF